ncbi:MAG: CHASE domain-containing protein [Pyrinomonadaceae bacterium]
MIRFQNEVSRVQSAFENRLSLYISLLKGGRGFVESVENLNWQNFANYVESLEIDKNYSGIQGIGFSKRIKADEKAALIEKMKSEGYTDFKIFPKTEKPIFHTIIYIEPMTDRNLRAIGFDMSTEENRREALDRAMDSGKASATGKVTLLQETGDDPQSGFLIYLPIYKFGQLPISVEERRENLVGYIYSPFRAGDFLKEIQQKTASRNIGFAIYDGEIKLENLMASVSGENGPVDQNLLGQTFHSRTELEVAGRTWKIEYYDLPQFSEQSSVSWTPLIFLSGVAFSFLLFGMTYWESTARAKLQITAAELFEMEKQKQVLLENEQQARLTAEKANATKDEFIAVVSHELKTPLNAIAGWTRILKTDELTENTKELALGKIEKNVRTQTKLVEELIDYSQILAGNSALQKELIEFSDLFDQCVGEIEPLASDKGIEFVKENHLNGQKVSGDELKLRTAFRNLLSNAIKFTDQGGRIETRVSEEKGQIQVAIKDNGRGIDSDFLPHIFERFWQADTSITRNVGGFGLGLTISNQIIKLHQGTIRAKSDGLGKGAEFIITIPTEKE